MARRLKSPTRTISNRGDRPKFIGEFSSMKSEKGYLVFDSLSSFLCGIYLEWRKDILSLDFEPQPVKVAGPNGRPMGLIPDYQVVFNTGEMGYVDAKYDPHQLSQREIMKLAAFQAHCVEQGAPYEVVYRSELEKDGFIQTILVLRRYQQARCPDATLRRVMQALEGCSAATLPIWRHRARENALSWAAVCKLLYSGTLPLLYEPIQSSGLAPWLD